MAHDINRRTFLNLAAAGAAGLAATGATQAKASTAPSDRVIVGVMGLSRGRTVASTFAQLPNVEVRYMCDTDSERAERGRGQIAEMEGQDPKAITDFRHILDDPEVDILICAAPNHWHAPASILACNAGKHVYVEKPCCHTPEEGELMVAAAKKYNKAVQVGTQRRSNPLMRASIERLHSGAIGRVYSARAYYSSARGTIGHGQPADVPATLDYDLWQGPSPRVPYTDNRIHYNWHWFWQWGNGELGNNGVHYLDLCRWGLQVDYPTFVSSAGGRYCFDDDQQTPDTHAVAYEFADDKLITWQGHSCNPQADDFVTFYGETGTLKVFSRGGFALYDKDGKELERGDEGDMGDSPHADDLIAAIRNNTPEKLNCGVAEAYPSTLLCHLGNIAQRTRRNLHCDPHNGHILSDREAIEHWTKPYEPGWEPKI